MFKRGVFNNGPALTAEQMTLCMTTIGQGSGDLWRLNNTRGNRHAGARSALLPWTDVLILSWDAITIRYGLTTTLYKNAFATQYEYSPVSAPTADVLALLVGRPHVRTSGHGVVFI